MTTTDTAPATDMASAIAQASKAACALEDTASRLKDLLCTIDGLTSNCTVIDRREYRDAAFRILEMAKADLEALEDFRCMVWKMCDPRARNATP